MLTLPLARLAGLVRDDKAVSMIEFTIALPVLGVLVMGIVDVSRGLSADFALEQAVQRAVEIATVAEQSNNYDSLRSEAASTAGIPLANVTVDHWLECNASRQPNVNAVCPSGQSRAQYVRVSAVSSYRPTFAYGPLQGLMSVQADGTVRIQADAGVRVE